MQVLHCKIGIGLVFADLSLQFIKDSLLHAGSLKSRYALEWGEDMCIVCFIKLLI